MDSKAPAVPQHDVTKASKAFRQVWQVMREVGLWSEVIILVCGIVIGFCRGVQVAARAASDIVGGKDPEGELPKGATPTVAPAADNVLPFPVE